jgi:hypothetical protein
VKESIEIVKKKCKWFLFCFENKRFWKRKNNFLFNGNEIGARVQRKLYFCRWSRK